MAWAFDPTFNLGNIVTIVSLLLGIVGAHIKTRERIQKIEVQVDIMYDWFSRFVVGTGALVVAARKKRDEAR